MNTSYGVPTSKSPIKATTIPPIGDLFALSTDQPTTDKSATKLLGDNILDLPSEIESASSTHVETDPNDHTIDIFSHNIYKKFCKEYSLSAKMDRSIVLTDSRSMGLRSYLDGKSLDNICVFTYPGCKLSEIAVRSMKQIISYRLRLVIYMGGIVDLIKKNPVTKTLYVRHDNIAKMTEEFTQTINSIRCLLKSAFPPMTVIFAGVCGCDINICICKNRASLLTRTFSTQVYWSVIGVYDITICWRKFLTHTLPLKCTNGSPDDATIIIIFYSMGYTREMLSSDNGLTYWQDYTKK